jgi:hypothetical protein
MMSHSIRQSPSHSVSISADHSILTTARIHLPHYWKAENVMTFAGSLGGSSIKTAGKLYFRSNHCVFIERVFGAANNHGGVQ